MNFVLLNVQGLKTKGIDKFQSVQFQTFFQNNDIILFTETWADEFSDLGVDGFIHYQLNRSEYKENTKRASGGIVIYIKEYLVSPDSEMLLLKENDDVLWIRITGSVLNLDGDLILCLCYNLPSDSSRQSLVDEDIFDRMCNFMVKVNNESENKCYFMICGDMNARISDRNDFVVDDTFVHIDTLPDDYVRDNELPRITQDKGFNSNGRSLLEFCRSTGLRVVNGRVADDACVGKCTYVGARGSSLIDYVIADPDLFKYFTKFYVDDPNIFSDHCVVNFSLHFNMSTVEEVNALDTDEEEILSFPCSGKYIWENNMSDIYLENLQSETVRQQLNRVNDRINNVNSSHDIDDTVDCFVSILDSVCEPFYKEVKQYNKTNKGQNSFKLKISKNEL